MRSLRVLAVLLVVGGCTWSNSLYQARRLVGEAERAERDGRDFDAQSYWDQAAVKADSAYARSPEGERGAEALWVRGQAQAKRRDCASAIVSFDAARIALPDARWREQLLLAVGRCRQEMSDPLALEHFMALRESTDPARRRESLLRAGHLATQGGDWDLALRLLAEEDSAPARIDRAVALGSLDRTDEALAVVEPLLVAADSAVVWDPLIRLLARQDTEDADRFLSRLMAAPHATDARKATWLLAAIEGALVSDPSAAERRFGELVALPPSRAVAEGRLLIAELRIARAVSMRGLRSAVQALGELASGGGIAAIRIGDLSRIGGRMLVEFDSVAAGQGAGDLTLFGLAEEARDSLNAPDVANALFQQLEQDWPASAYLPKALIARMGLAPDSITSLQQRLANHSDSPYLAYTRGEVHPRFAVLEDSLSNFLRERARLRVAAAMPVDHE